MSKECDIRIFLLLVTVVGCAVGETWGMEQVRLLPTAVIVEEQVTLGDVCDLSHVSEASRLEVAWTVVASAPGGGQRKSISAEQVQRALRAAGMNPATTLLTGATRVTVRRASLDGAGEQVDAPPRNQDGGGNDSAGGDGEPLLDAVRKAFALHNVNGGGRVDLQFGRISSEASAFSAGRCEFNVRPVSGRWLGRMLNVEVDGTCGGALETVRLVVSASLMRRVVVARHAINLKSTIAAEDVALVERAFDRHAEAATRLESVVGQRAKRFIESGSIVSPADLEKVPLVKRGELVQVSSSSGPVSVLSVGQAKGDGVLGDMVEVQIGGRRGESVMAKVVAKGRVRIGELRAVGAAEQLAMGGRDAY